MRIPFRDLLTAAVRGLNEDAMAQDVTFVLKRLLAAYRGLDPTDPERRQSPDYGVAASLEANVLDVVLTFKKDRFYVPLSHA